MEKALIINDVCKMLLKNLKEDALKVINENYKFNYENVQKRAYTDKEKMKIFMRDGFIDRYSGDKLVIPGILKVLSIYYPKDFPYQAHWKMNETHIAYWELVPTIDHIVPIATGGNDEEENWITTSMLHNSIKSNWSLEQIGWSVQKPGNIREWDGLTNVFIKLVEKDTELLKDNYIKKWYSLAKLFVSN